VEDGEGGAREIISKTTQRLRLDSTKYRIPISYRATVAAGRISRLVLPIEAEKSSTHDFRIVIQLGDGQEISSRPINLLYYRPRWFAEYNKRDFQSEDFSHDRYHFTGTDLRELRDSNSWSCKEACEAAPLCRAFTADNWDGRCSLKSAVNLMRFDPRYTSGLMRETQPPPSAGDPRVMERFPLKAFSGYGYLIEQGTDVEKCDRVCAADETCVAFTFRKKTGDCSLFDDASGVYSTDPNADSGIKRQPAR
jgi:PAN domain